MKMKCFTEADFTTTRWSGGSTCELYLYPETGSYAQRDFLFRLSSASVEQDAAPFTPLPGVQRRLVLLEGNLALEQPGKGRRVLKPFWPVAFSGETEIRSFGKGRDFNLMLREGLEGQLICRQLAKNEAAKINTPSCGPGTYWKAIYAAEGNVSVRTEREGLELAEGQLALLQDCSPFAAKVACDAESSAKLVFADVFLSKEIGSL